MSYTPWNKSIGGTEPTPGETHIGFIQRMAVLDQETRGRFFEQHCKKHYCHYGNFPCYICPIWDAMTQMSRDQQIDKLLAEELQVELVWSQNEGNNAYDWQLYPLRTAKPLRKRRPKPELKKS